MIAPPPIRLMLVTGDDAALRRFVIEAAFSHAATNLRIVSQNRLGEEHSVEPLPAGVEALLSTDACLCCRRGAFTNLLEAFLRAIDNGRMAPIETLVVETSDEADPVNLISEWMAHPYLSKRYRLDAIIAAIAHIAATDEAARRQIASATLIVVGHAAAGEPEQHVSTANPAAHVVNATADLALALASVPAFDTARLPETTRRRLLAGALGPAQPRRSWHAI